LREVLEQLFDVHASLSARFDKHDTQLLRQSLSLIGAYLPLLSLIYFVSNEYNEKVIPADGFSIVYPLSHIIE
jgi:hypothetical protein